MSQLKKEDEEKRLKQKITEIEKELEEDIRKEKKKSPLWMIIGLFLALILVAMILPSKIIKLDEAPAKTVSWEEIKELIQENNQNWDKSTIKNWEEYKILKTSDEIKKAANKIVGEACRQGKKVCQTKAIYYFVRDEIRYVSDPQQREYWERPEEVLISGVGDCESGAQLLRSLLRAVGIEAELIVVPGHALVRAKLEEAPKNYKREGWIYLDWTCQKCQIGELNPEISKEVELLY